MNHGPHISNWHGDSFSLTLPWDQFEHAVLESPSKTTLLQSPRLGDFSPDDFSSGSLFGKQCELKWRRRRNGEFHLVLIAEESVSPLPQAQPRPLTPIKAGEYGLPDRIYLWGQPHGKHGSCQWYEGRIPRVISEYPQEFAGRRVAMRLAHYSMEISVPLPAPMPAEIRTIVVSRSAGLEGR